MSRRKGMSIVEGLILMVVLAIAIWAIMSTAIWTTQLQTSSRGDIGVRTLATSWFEVFESINPEGMDFDDAKARVVATLEGSGDYISGFKVEAKEISVSGGVRTVELRLSQPASKKAPVTIRRRVNSMSHETVSDDRVGGL